jgi:hypothetical protein
LTSEAAARSNDAGCAARHEKGQTAVDDLLTFDVYFDYG